MTEAPQSYPGSSGLLPCPFCGESIEPPFDNLRDMPDDEPPTKCFTIMHFCHATKCTLWAEGNTHVECTDAWNTRAPQSVSVAQRQPDRDAIYRAIESNVRSEPDKNFIDRRWMVGINDAVDAILALSSTHVCTLEEAATRLCNELTGQNIQREMFSIGIGANELHVYIQLPRVNCRADRIGGWNVVWHFNVGPTVAFASPEVK